MTILDNAPVRRIHFQGLTIEGYSRAAMQSYWRVPELGLGFDLGGQPWEFAKTPNWFVSHAHLDHIAALPLIARWRRKLRLSPPRVMLPKQNLADARELLRLWKEVDRRALDCELVGLEPGDEIELSPDYVVSAFATRHTVPSLGFIVWQRPGLQNNAPPLAVPGGPAGVPGDTGSTALQRVPLLCYTGDTAPEGLDENPVAFEAKILITEMTFVDPRHRRDLIHKHGHLHLDDIVSRSDRFRNELIIVAHVTARSYSAQVHRCIEQLVPASLRQRLAVWM